MSPEEIEWDNSGARRGASEQFHAHLSADIHSAGSILFYVMSGGLHCFGESGLDQQLNIRRGSPDFTALAAADPVAVDLVTRMVCREPGRRLRIDGLLLGDIRTRAMLPDESLGAQRRFHPCRKPGT